MARLFFCLGMVYPSEGASTGQTDAQAPQSEHLSASMVYGSPSEIASTGHSDWQAPQEMQLSSITYAIIILLFNSPALLMFADNGPLGRSLLWYHK